MRFWGETMDRFTVTLDVHGSERRSKIRELRSLATNAEERFWQRFREQATLGQDPLAVRPLVPNDINDIQAQFRSKFPRSLKLELVKELRIHFGLSEYEGEADDRRREFQRSLDALVIHVKAIRGGSLEILLFALGFAKLVSLTGIRSEDFAKFLEITAPIAMNSIFGTNVLLEVDAKPSPDVSAGGVSSETDRSSMRPRVVQNPFLMPAIFGLAVFGCAMWGFLTMSSELAAERKRGADDIGKERAAIAEKLSALLSTHDTNLAEERKEFIKK